MFAADMTAPATAGILGAIAALKKDIASKLDGVLTVTNGIQSDLKDFATRLEQAEDRIGNIEDDFTGEKTKTAVLEKQGAELTAKIDDLENRSRRSNLRLVNLPEKVERGNAVAFLEKLLPDILRLETLPVPMVIESAHRLPGAQHSSDDDIEVFKFQQENLSHASGDEERQDHV